MGLRNKKEMTSSAEVIDKHLILSLPNATEPVVWRMALDKIGTASFEIKQAKNSDTYKLVLKPAKGTAETIAPFDTKDEAVAALMDASEALQNPANIVAAPQASVKASKEPASIQASPAAPYAVAPRSPHARNWFYLFIGFLAVIGLYLYMTSLMPGNMNEMGGQATPNPTATMSEGLQSRPSDTGVPLSADDFLNGL